MQQLSKEAGNLLDKFNEKLIDSVLPYSFNLKKEGYGLVQGPLFYMDKKKLKAAVFFINSEAEAIDINFVLKKFRSDKEAFDLIDDYFLAAANFTLEQINNQLFNLKMSEYTIQDILNAKAEINEDIENINESVKGILVKSFDKIKGIPGKFKKGKAVSKQNVSDSKKEKASDKIHSLLVKKNIIEEDINDNMFLFEDEFDEELDRDIPDDAEEIEEMFNELINEEEFDDEESDDLDEIEDAEEEDGVEIIDSDHPDYDEPIILDKDETISTDVANSDNEIEEGSLFDEDDDEETRPGYSELRAKFLDSQMIVPTTFGPQNSVSVNTSNSNVSASSVSDGGMSAANGSASVSGAVTESASPGPYLYEKDPAPEFTYVDLRNGILATDAKVGYTIGTPEVDDVKKDGKVDIIANENYVDDKNKAFPFIAIGEEFSFAAVKSFKGVSEKIHENLLNSFMLESKDQKQIFVTNESINTIRQFLSETGKIENGKMVCESCGNKLTMNESNELVCENCNEEIEEALQTSKEVGEVICNECGVQEEVDPNTNEDELVCENCGSTDVEFKTKTVNEDQVNEHYTTKDLVRYANALSESLGKRVDIVIHKESYLDELPKAYNPSSLLVDKVDFGKGFKKVIVVEPKVNKVLKEFYTDQEISLENLEEEFSMNVVQRVNNESESGLLENFLNPLDEVNEDVKDILNEEVDLESLEESIMIDLKHKDDVLYEGYEESLEEYYEDIVFEAYENVPNKDETRLKKFLEENINDLNVSKVIQVNESSISINGHNSVSFDEYTEEELMEKLSEENRLERDLLNENIFKIINI